VDDLRDTLLDFRKKQNAGRAVAAPQIGVMKRIVFMMIDEPVVFVNPVLDNFSDETFELWDDCMSFPDLLVKVRRFKSCTISYKDDNWNDKSMELNGSLSELLQHEVDHLNGILAVERAIDNRSFALKGQVEFERTFPV
jgi:peptide deformylase